MPSALHRLPSLDGVVSQHPPASHRLRRSGRKRNLLDVARFLTFAVKKCGADSRWLPLQGEELSELVGVREVAEQDTPPIKPEQLSALLDSLDESPEVRLAVALVGLFGLRPSELMELEVREGNLYVGQTKRNRDSAAKPDRNHLLALQPLPSVWLTSNSLTESMM